MRRASGNASRDSLGAVDFSRAVSPSPTAAGLREIARTTARTTSLRGYLFAVTAIVCALLVAVSAVLIWHSHTEQLRAVQSEAENLTVSLAQQATDTFITDDAILIGLAEQVGADGTASSRQIRRLDRLARSYVANVPSLHGIFITDRTGRVLVSALPVPPKHLNLSDREDFRFHAAHVRRGLFIGMPMRGKSDGTWIIPLSRRLSGADGTFDGMVSCTVSLAYFDHLYRSVELGKRSVIDLIRDDGTLLVRAPFNTRFFAKNLASSVLFTQYAKRSRSGTFATVSPLDGVQRLFAFRRIERFPIVVLVAFSEADAFADWRSNSAATLLIALAVVVILSGLAMLLGRELRKSQRMENDLARLAFRDGLTGLANRRFFDEMLDREWRRAARDKSTLSVLMIDVDSFKSFNDTHGHQLGDAALLAIASCAKSCVKRVSDVTARYGGEEFVVLLPMTDASGAFALAEQIRTAVRAIRIVAKDGSSIEVTISIGVSSAADASQGSAAELIGAADAALYAAKRGGRNQTVAAGTRATEGQIGAHGA